MESEGAAAGVRRVEEVMPRSGLVYSERGGLQEALCKPKLLPLKSAVLEQLRKAEANERPDDS